MPLLPLPLDNPERLEALRRSQLLDSASEIDFDRVSRIAAHILNVPVCLLSLVDDKRQFFKSAIGLGGWAGEARQTPLTHSFCQHVVTSGAPLIVEDAPSHTVVHDNLAIRDLGVGSYLGIPIRDTEGYVLGAFCAIDGKPRQWSPDDRSRLEDLAQLIMTEIALRERNQSLIAARDAAETATRAKADFLANMSHEIRTPMNAVLGMAELLQHTSLTGEQADFVGTIGTSGSALLSLINDILDFSKIESGRLELEHIPLNLRECVESSLDLTARPAAAKGLEVYTVTAPDLPEHILGDSTRLRQILVNLSTNAIKFTRSGEVVITLSRRPACTSGNVSLPEQLHVSVRDTGMGIPADRIDRLFQAFSQVDASTTRQFGGSGLGLAICRRLVTLMNGKIWVESKPGHGANFQFEIPLHIPLAASPAVAVPVAFSGKRVLVIDGNPGKLQMLTRQFSDWGLLPTPAAFGSEALFQLDGKDAFDAVLIDLTTISADGLAFATELRRRPAAATLPLIALVPIGEDQQRIAPLSPARIISKPLKTSALLDAFTALFASLPNKPKPVAGDAGNIHADQYPLNVLLAEDHPTNQLVAQLLLSKLGYSCITVANGLEVLDAVSRNVIDVILLDVQMPEMDGMEAARRLCSLYPTHKRPWIIAMTANAMAGDREECLAAGMDDYITKPISAQAISRALNQAHARLAQRVSSRRSQAVN